VRAEIAAMQQMLAAVGIKVKFQEYETAAWVAKFYDTHDYEAVFIGAGTFSDPDGFLKFHMFKGSKDAFGYVDVAGPEFASWVDEGGRLVDPNKRKEVYFKIQDKLNEDVPVAVLWVQSDIWVLNQKVYIPYLTEGPKVKTVKDEPVLPAQRHFFYNMHEWGMKV
jgi:peptide/nickel transport system substrate-binding protein